MRNCEEIRCAINAIERPLSSCRNFKANPTRTIFIYWRPFIFTSFGSYFAKKIYSRICSWIAYAPFITLLLIIWHQDISTSSIIANAKIAACIALVPCLFRFRTYGLTFGLFALWSALLWDMKEVQSLVILERMSSLMTSNFKYIMLLVGGLIFGGLLAMLIHRKEKDDNKENINLFKQKRSIKIIL